MVRQCKQMILFEYVLSLEVLRYYGETIYQHNILITANKGENVNTNSPY